MFALLVKYGIYSLCCQLNWQHTQYKLPKLKWKLWKCSPNMASHTNLHTVCVCLSFLFLTCYVQCCSAISKIRGNSKQHIFELSVRKAQVHYMKSGGRCWHVMTHPVFQTSKDWNHTSSCSIYSCKYAPHSLKVEKKE